MPGEDGAAVLRAHEGEYTRYWLESGEVRSCDITEDELPLAGFGPVGGPLPVLLGAVSAEFGPQLPKPAADLASGAPALDSVERVLRDRSLCGGATALKMLFEHLDEALLPPPECANCGKLMRRRHARKKNPGSTGLVGSRSSAAIIIADRAAMASFRLTVRLAWTVARSRRGC